MPNLSDKLISTYNQRLNLVKPSEIRAFDQKVSKIEGLIKLTLGEPDFDTPNHIKQAAVAAIDDNETHYSAQPGTVELRQAIGGYLERVHGLHYRYQDEIIATVGATEAVYAVFATLINPGDKIIIPTPAFALYAPIITLLGGQVIEVDTSRANFKLTPAALEAVLQGEGANAKAILLNYPNNPTGVELNSDEVQALAKVLGRYPLFVISDEIYSDLTYGVEHQSFAELLPEQTIYISGVSKSYAMTGWRIGFVAGPAAIMAKILKTHAFLVTCPSGIDQAAAAEALENGDADTAAMRATYQERCDYLIQAMNDLGFETIMPTGAFYLFAKIPAHYGDDDTAFALRLAREAKVGVIPGSAFGAGGEGYVRLSYAAALDDLKRAMEQIRMALTHGRLQ